MAFAKSRASFLRPGDLRGATAPSGQGRLFLASRDSNHLGILAVQLQQRVRSFGTDCDGRIGQAHTESRRPALVGQPRHRSSFIARRKTSYKVSPTAFQTRHHKRCPLFNGRQHCPGSEILRAD